MSSALEDDMERNLTSRLRLSPNELEAALREERDKWKVFRIQQVREQSKEEAKRIREAIQNEKLRMLQDLRQELHLKYKAEKENQVHQLRQEYNDCLQALGEAHEQAQRQPDACEILRQRAKHNKKEAERRGVQARKVHREQQLQQYHEKNKLLKQRQDALHWEKLRANRVANLPTPEAFKKKRSVVEKKVPTVQFYEAGTFTTTNYVPKNIIIEKEVKSTKPTAKEAAILEEKAQAARKEVNRKEAEEEERKRQQRGREALAKERLCRMYHQLMNQLDQAQHNHQLSTYLKGTDLSVNETEESRLKNQASLQRQMEKAVEKVLQKSALPTDDDFREHTQLSSDSSDFIKADETTEIESDQQTFNTEIQDLKSFLEQIRKRRQQLLQGIYKSLSEEEETIEEGVDKSNTVVDESAIAHIKKADVSSEVHQLPTKITSHGVEDIMEGTLVDENHIDQDSHKASWPVGEDEDIHMAETVPFHLFQGHQDGKSTVVSWRNGSQPTSAMSSYQESVSEDTDIRINGIPMGTQSSTDEYTRPTSPIIHNLPTNKHSVQHSNSGISTSTYVSPPSSFPTSKVLTGETGDNLKKILNWRKCLPSKSLSEEFGDPHMAETVPVHLLSGYYNDKSMNKHQTSTSQPSSAKSSFQESNVEGTEGKVHIIGGGSSRKTLTQSKENLRHVLPTVDPLSLTNFPAEYVTSDTSSTDYLSPPSTLPTAEVYDNLKKIQQRRKTVQHLLDSISDERYQHTSHEKATSPNVYTEKLKGEGSGKRPLRKKEKFEMQKKEILQYYMKKLLRMKGDELLNLSASSVEGSGFTVSSLSTLMESVQKEEDDTVTVSSFDSYVPSPKELSHSNSTSSYTDIDEIPVKLGCHSSLKNKNSCLDKLSVSHISDPLEGYSTQYTVPSKHYNEESRTKHEPTQYLLSSATANSYDTGGSSPDTMVSSCSQSDKSRPSSSTKQVHETSNFQTQLEILENLRKLQKLRQDLMAEKDNVFRDESSDKMPEVSSSFPRYRSEVTTTIPADSSSIKSTRKVSFGGTHPRAGLSTIYECSSDLSESHLNISGSASYQTPSRECESSMDDTGSQVSLSNRYDPGTLHTPTVTKTWNEDDMGKERSTEALGKKFTHLHTPLDFKSNLSYSELSHCKDAQKSGISNYLGSDTSEFSSLLGEITQHSGILSCDNEHYVHSSSSAASLPKPEEVGSAMNAKSVHSSPDLYDQVKAQGDPSIQILGTEEDLGGTSRYVPLDLESTLTSSDHHEIAHSNATNIPAKESSVSSDSVENHDKQLQRSSSSDSITSIPDMAEILHRFGLDWAQSMIRKMEKTEQRSSSDSSATHGN